MISDNKKNNLLGEAKYLIKKFNVGFGELSNLICCFFKNLEQCFFIHSLMLVCEK